MIFQTAIDSAAGNAPRRFGTQERTAVVRPADVADSSTSTRCQTRSVDFADHAHLIVLSRHRPHPEDDRAGRVSGNSTSFSPTHEGITSTIS